MKCLKCGRNVPETEGDNFSCPCVAVFNSNELEYEYDTKLHELIALWKKETGQTNLPMDGDETLVLGRIIQTKID